MNWNFWRRWFLPKPKGTERQIAVRKAMASLSRHGLRITGLKCHPMTFMYMVNESVLGAEVQIIDGKWEGTITAKNSCPMHTYCGIPVEQDANEPPPIS